jgi:anti-sigma regulatory factor (Ser/Thr protein kinase)
MPESNEDTSVVVTVPGQAAQAALLRLLVSSLAADTGCSIDEIDDLRLAVSEVFNAYVAAGAVRVSLAVTPDRGSIQLQFDTEVTEPDPLDELAAAIMSSVVDAVVRSGTRTVVSKRLTELTRERGA